MNERKVDWVDPKRLFSYHKPGPDNVEKIRELREAHRDLAARITDLVPLCPERTMALRALHQCSMHTNYAIVADDPIDS